MFPRYLTTPNLLGSIVNYCSCRVAICYNTNKEMLFQSIRKRGPTTHICVVNTVSALKFMICFLFNFNNNVKIICERHQLVYFAIITANKPTTPPDFSCMAPFVRKQIPKCHFFGPKNNTKNYTNLSCILKLQRICSKMKSLHLQRTSKSDLGV